MRKIIYEIPNLQPKKKKQPRFDYLTELFFLSIILIKILCMPKLTTFKLLTRKSKEFILSHGKKKKRLMKTLSITSIILISKLKLKKRNPQICSMFLL